MPKNKTIFAVNTSIEVDGNLINPLRGRSFIYGGAKCAGMGVYYESPGQRPCGWVCLHAQTYGHWTGKPV